MEDKPLDVDAVDENTTENQEIAEKTTQKVKPLEEGYSGENTEEIIADLKDQLLRSIAENQNLRRRMEREKEDAYKFAVSKFAKELLSVADNLDRALASIPEGALENEAVKGVVVGLDLTQKDLVRAFGTAGIFAHKPKEGDAFDHNFHQAMFEAESQEHKPGTILHVTQVGYSIADRLLRPAMVGVVKEKS